MDAHLYNDDTCEKGKKKKGALQFAIVRDICPLSEKLNQWIFHYRMLIVT